MTAHGGNGTTSKFITHGEPPSGEPGGSAQGKERWRIEESSLAQMCPNAGK